MQLGSWSHPATLMISLPNPFTRSASYLIVRVTSNISTSIAEHQDIPELLLMHDHSASSILNGSRKRIKTAKHGLAKSPPFLVKDFDRKLRREKWGALTEKFWDRKIAPCASLPCSAKSISISFFCPEFFCQMSFGFRISDVKVSHGPPSLAPFDLSFPGSL